ncbi:YozE family protein [Luteimonas sp. A478]
MTRYYFHGDKSEEDSSLYYCAICDVFAEREHFETHGDKNRDRHDRSVAHFKNVTSSYTRPKNPPALADEWPMPSKPSRSSFYSWLLKQRDRDDPVGDLSSDVACDRNFPSSSQSLDNLERHIAVKGACEEALTALREAFSEFLAKGKARSGISPKLRFEIFKKFSYCCQICGRRASLDLTLEIDHKIPVAKGGSNDPENLWVLCFDCNRGKGTRDL